MNIDDVKEAIKTTQFALDQSAANHNALIGKLQAFNEMLLMMENVAKGVIDVVESIVEAV